LYQWFSKHGIWNRSIKIPWELVRNADCWVLPLPIGSGTLGYSPVIAVSKLIQV
jgi:hypothetical protein